MTTDTDSSVSDPANPPNSPISSDEAKWIQQKRANEAAQTMQAECMVKRSKHVFASVQVGDNVTIPIPNVDRGRNDPQNIIGVVT